MKINKLVILLLIVGMPFSILNSEFELSSSDVIFYNVSLAGAVDNPGIYTVPPSTRVSSVLKIARKKPPQVIDNIDLEESSQEEVDLVKKRYENYYKEEDEIINSFNGSRRNIILKRGEEEITIDLLRFFRLGDINNNPYVMDGDIIYITPKNGVINVSGAVHREGGIEYKEGDKVSDIIDLALGMKNEAWLPEVEIVRFISAEQTEKILVDYNKIIADYNCKDNIELQLDDRIFVRYKPVFHQKKEVTVAGEVKFPGIYVIDEGTTTLYDIIILCGNPTDEADLHNAFVQREDGQSEFDPEFERLKLMPVNTMNKIEYAYFKNYIRELNGEYSTNIAALLEEKGSTDNLLLQAGDLIVFPRISSFINVTGQVLEPGLVTFETGKTFEYYIEQAGGYGWNAKKSKVRIIRSNTGKWIKPSEELVLKEGDTIFIPEKPEFDTWQFALDSLRIISSIATIVITINTLTSGN